MKKAIIAAALIIAGLAAYLYFIEREYVVRIPESELQSRLNEQLPITETYLFIFQITLDNPRVALEEGSNRVHGGLDIILNMRIDEESEPLEGSIDISGGIRYVSDNGQFFLVEPIIEKLNVQGVPEKYTDTISSAFTELIEEYYARHPIYTLNVSDGKQAAARLILKSVVVDNKELVLVMGL